MPTYLVRTIDDHAPVGIFVAPNILALALLVDECVDPGECEYQRMKPGGIMWTVPAVVVPLVFDEDDEDFTAPANYLVRSFIDRELAGSILPVVQQRKMAGY